MCLGDWRIGRLISSNCYQVLIAAGATLILPANNQRVGLRVTPWFAAGAVNTDCQVTVNGAFFLTFDTAQWADMITVAQHGDLPMQSFSIKNLGGSNQIIGIVEMTLPESILAAALEQFQSEYGQWLSR